VFLIAAYNGAQGFFSEAGLREELHDMFGRYVPPRHIDQMLADPDSVTFAGETKEMSVLFADIRDFTSISERLDVNQLKELLNDFFTPMTSIIFDAHGTIDKYIGDLVMAFWGAPLSDLQHRNHAIGAALKMLETLDEMRPQFVERGLPEIYIGIGINSGVMNVGDMGSEYRRSYTVLGDAVNLGARLEGLTKYYGVSLLVGEKTRDGCDEYLYRYIDTVMVKGKEEPIRIYEPLCPLAKATEAQRDMAAEHSFAMGAYMEQRWDEAQQRFRRIQAQYPRIQVDLFLERIETLRDSRLPLDWDGAFRHTQK
jgi:adenylate cyclase